MSASQEADSPELRLRPACPGDARLFWEWANDPTVRASAFSRDPIPWEGHLRWFEARLAAPGTRIWVFEVDGKPAGQIRYDRDPDGRSAEISFSVARGQRGRGIGTEMIRRTCPLAVEELGVEEIVAVAFAENAPSYRAFLRCGFTTPGVIEIKGRSCYRLTWRPTSGTAR